MDEPICVSEKFWYRKMLGIRERGSTIFRRNYFVGHYRTVSWKNPSVFQKLSGIESNLG